MDQITEPQAAPAQEEAWTWAIVEIFGHRRHAGRVREEEKFGAKMLRVDEPIYTGRKESDRWDAKVIELRLDRWETHYYGGASIFSFTPTDEATVLKLREREASIDPPARFQLTDETDTIEAEAQEEPEYQDDATGE